MKNYAWVAVLLAGCGGDQAPCGAGTERQGSMCVVVGGGSGPCGQGTAKVGDRCVPDLAAVCGTDTTGFGDRCIGTVTCGTGTMRIGTSCVQTGATMTVTCGAGTQLQGTECVVSTVAAGPVSTFVTSPTLRAAAYLDSTSTTKRIVLTDLSQGNADAWVNTGANMIGSGRALHFGGYGYWSVTESTPRYLTIQDPGACSAGSLPTQSANSSSSVLLGFYQWASGMPSRLSCARQGSVKLESLYNSQTGHYQTRVTLNAVFTDGSTLTDKTFVF